MHRRWWINDPDCLLVRPQTHLTLAEVQTTAAVIALTGGSLLLSDDLPALAESAEGRERLRIARMLLPPIGERSRVLDWLDAAVPLHVRLDLENETGRWHLLARFNWEDTPQMMRFDPERFGLPGGNYWQRSFWDQTVKTSGRQEYLLPAHGVCLLAVRPVAPGEPQYLGSDLHISQGLEVCKWEWDAGGGRLAINLKRLGKIHGSVDLALPRSPVRATLNGEPQEWQHLEGDAYRFPVEFVDIGNLILHT